MAYTPGMHSPRRLTPYGPDWEASLVIPGWTEALYGHGWRGAAMLAGAAAAWILLPFPFAALYHGLAALLAKAFIRRRRPPYLVRAPWMPPTPNAREDERHAVVEWMSPPPKLRRWAERRGARWPDRSP
jgi:hypothetical protein